MTKPAKPMAFVVNGQPVAVLDKYGKLNPQNIPPVRIDQMDSSAEIGRQAWIAETIFCGSGNPERGMG